MIVKRIGAVLVAVGLIVGAIVLRHSMDNSSSPGSSPSTTPATTSTASVICATEFAELCKQLVGSFDVTIEPAGVTLDRLAKASGSQLPDAWLTLDPFPAMLDDTRVRFGLSTVVRDTTVIGVTDPALVMLTDRATAFKAACAASVPWRCLGELAGSAWSDHAGQVSWGTVRPALSDPASEATGLLGFANAVGGYFNSVDFDRNSWETDPKFSSWLRNLTANTLVVLSGSTPLSTILVRQSALNIAATSEAEVSQVPTSSRTKFGVVGPTPPITLSLVLSRFRSTSASLTTTLGNLAQTRFGWRAPTGAKPKLPAGTFIALRQLWKDAT